MLSKGRIRRFPICRVAQYASLIAFYENPFQHIQRFSKFIPNFLIGLLTERQFTNGLNSWRKGSVIHQPNLCKGTEGVEVVDELVEIVDQGLYNMTNYLA